MDRARFRPRITLRWLMALVAIVALALWIRSQVEARRAYLEARRLQFDRLAREYHNKRYAASAFSYSGPAGAVMEARMKADAARRARLSEHYTKMIDKYEKAARSPWLDVEPDPPEPEDIKGPE